MKKRLILTQVFLLASLLISAQATITTANDVETFTVSSIENATATASIGTFSTAATYIQLRGNGGITADLSGDIQFDLQTESETVDGNLSFEFKKIGGTTADITISVTGYTDETFSFPDNASATPNSYETIIIDFAQTVTFSSTATTIIFKMTDVDQASATILPAARLFKTTIDKTTSLSVDDINEESEFTIYPNPANNSFEINTKENIKNVKIYNTTGSLIKTFQQINKRYDISDLSTGIYIANISTLSGFKTMKIVKR